MLEGVHEFPLKFKGKVDRSIQKTEGTCRGFTLTVTAALAHKYPTIASAHLDRKSHSLISSSLILGWSSRTHGRRAGGMGNLSEGMGPKFALVIWTLPLLNNNKTTTRHPTHPISQDEMTERNKIRRHASTNGITVGRHSVTCDGKNKYIDANTYTFVKALINIWFLRALQYPFEVIWLATVPIW